MEKSLWFETLWDPEIMWWQSVVIKWQNQEVYKLYPAEWPTDINWITYDSLEILEKYRKIQNEYAKNIIDFKVNDKVYIEWEKINRIIINTLELSDIYTEWYSPIDKKEYTIHKVKEVEWENIYDLLDKGTFSYNLIILILNKIIEKFWLINYENLIEPVNIKYVDLVDDCLHLTITDVSSSILEIVQKNTWIEFISWNETRYLIEEIEKSQEQFFKNIMHIDWKTLTLREQLEEEVWITDFIISKEDFEIIINWKKWEKDFKWKIPEEMIEEIKGFNITASSIFLHFYLWDNWEVLCEQEDDKDNF